jgi:hypothetical protein
VTNLARFVVNGSPSSARGFDGTNSLGLTFALEAVTGAVQRWTLEVYSPLDGNSPLQSKGAPALTLVGATSGQKVNAATPAASITTTLPASGYHTYKVRSTVNGGLDAYGRPSPDLVFERIVAIRTPAGRRKILATESSEYEAAGWAGAQNDDVDAAADPVVVNNTARTVTSFGAVGDGVTSDQTALVAAVLDAWTRGVPLIWPDGAYVSTANIPHLHEVRHQGDGVVKRGSDLFVPAPSWGDTNRLYLASGGSSSNDGLSASQPMLTPQNAFDALRNYGPTLEGTWRVVLAAGTWNGTVHRHQHATPSKNAVIVEGPNVGIGTPTAILDGASGAVADDWCIRATGGGVQIDLRHLKAQNYTGGSPWTADYGAAFFSTNLHGSGSDYADIYLQGCSTVRITGGTLASPRGAMINSCKDTTVGYQTGTTFSGNTVCGIEWSRGSQGHVDNCSFNDCAVGVEVMHSGRVHLQANNLKRCTVAGWRTRPGGFVTESGPNVYNDGTADANATRFIRHAYSGETDSHLWSSYSEVLAAHDYNTYVHDGTVGGNATTNVVANVYKIPAHEFETKPQRLRVVVTGKFHTWVGAPPRIGANIGATLIDQTQPKTSGASGVAGQPLNGSIFEYECVINALAPDSQTMRASLRYDGGTLGPNIQSFSRAADTDADQYLHITAKLNNASGDRVEIYSVEVYRLG